MAKPSRPRRKPGARSGGAPKLYAALDLGTNNCRLLIAERAASGGLRVVDSYSQIVALGEGLAASGSLSPAAMGRAIEALKKCHDKVKRHRPAQARFIATQACREASNGRAFLADVRTQVGLRLEMISPKEEAKYALLGSLDLVDPAQDFALVVDIGGGSTELCWIDARSAVARGIEGCTQRPPILGWASFPVGVVTLGERVGGAVGAGFDAMKAHVRDLLLAHDAASRFGPLFRAGRGQLIGNSGTVTSLTAVHIGLERYQRPLVDGVRVEAHGLRETMKRLAAASPAERAREPCLAGGRADLMPPGIAILDALWEVWPTSHLRVGDRGLREGIILSMMHAPAAPRRPRAGRRPRAPSGAGPRREDAPA